MFEKFAGKFGKHFSKEAMESAKETIVKDVKENHSLYIATGVLAVVAVVGIGVLTKKIISPESIGRTINVTNNYYIHIHKHYIDPAQKVAEAAAKLAT